MMPPEMNPSIGGCCSAPSTLVGSRHLWVGMSLIDERTDRLLIFGQRVTDADRP
jgi:hypothetical protein